MPDQSAFRARVIDLRELTGHGAPVLGRVPKPEPGGGAARGHFDWGDGEILGPFQW